MAARANKHRGFEAIVDDPQAPVATDALDGRSKAQTRSRSPKQVLIEFASADAKADRLVVRRLNTSDTADQADTKPSEWLERPSVPIPVNIQPQIRQDLRRDPSRAHLVAREGRSVHDDDIETRLAEGPRAGRTRRTATGDEHVTGFHALL